MLKDELKNIDQSEVAVKKTGLTVGIVLILISMLLWYFGKLSFIYFSSIGGVICHLIFYCSHSFASIP